MTAAMSSASSNASDTNYYLLCADTLTGTTVDKQWASRPPW